METEREEKTLWIISDSGTDSFSLYNNPRCDHRDEQMVVKEGRNFVMYFQTSILEAGEGRSTTVYWIAICWDIFGYTVP